ncbi:MAG TPA: M48 family metallopeptidase [Terriglobales bacterium]|nr:M48 family metallopeptidase [Terriglobales bacterium]
MLMHSVRARFLALFLAITMAVGCGAPRAQKPLAPGPEAFPQPEGFNQFSIEQEIELGRQAAAEADQQLPLVPANNPLSEYVNRIGQNLAGKIPDSKFVYNFKVVNMKEINAFALPGGPVRINVGVITAADNEAELAGVIAHEISHVYMRHATRNASRQMAAQIPAAILGSILGGGVGGQLARLGISFGLGSVFLKYSRDAEREADLVGAKILYEAGYDPHAMVSFFEKLQKEGGSRGPEFLSSHPDPGNRAQLVSTAIGELPPKSYRQNTAEFRRMHEVAMGLKPSSAEEVAQRQQQRAPMGDLSVSDIAPSRSFRTLQHSVFQISYPENWQVYGNSSSPVTIAPAAGVSQDAIAYGVIISGFRPQRSGSLAAATEELYGMLRQSNPELQMVGGVQRAAVSGMQAMAVNLAGRSPLRTRDGRPVAERDLLITVQRQDGSVLWILFVSPEAHFDELRPTFEAMLQSLRVG